MRRSCKRSNITVYSVPMTRMPALAVALLIASVPLSAQASKMKLEEVLRLTPSTTAQGVSAPGHSFQADRGSRKGQYLHVGTGAAADAGALGPATSEYQLLGPKTAGALPEIDVLGIHYLKVRPDRREAFDTFVARTLNPAVASLRPDLRLLYYKAVRGPDTGSYITIFALTRESRDKYWPGGADSDALRAAFAPVKTHTKELLTYLVEGSALTDEKFAAAVYESRDWSDFVLVAKPQ
jgi:hypothetical protein